MMRKSLLPQALAFSFLALSSVAFFAACNGSLNLGLTGQSSNGSQNPSNNPTTAHAVIPDTIALDVSEMPDDGSTPAKDDNQQGGDHGGEQGDDHGHDQCARAGANLIYGFHDAADRILALAAQIRSDITDPNQTQVSGTLHVGHKDVPYKADFSAFDFNGDGTPDGSGHANVEPVALRLWVDSGNGFNPLLCALITTRPSDTNLGAGSIYIKPSALGGDAPADLQLFVTYDRTDPTHQWNDAFFTGRIRPKVTISAGHARVDLRTYSDNHVEKTARVTVNFTDDPYGFDSFASALHWARGSNAALVSGKSTGGTTQIDFSNVCVRIGDRHLALASQCASFDTQDMTFLDSPTGNETTFPADFPATPTF